MGNTRELNEALTEGQYVAAPKYFVADTASDIADLPKYPQVAWGSFCVCLDGDIYVLRKKTNTWEVFGE